MHVCIQLGHINDCKTKLTIMAFIGAFDDVSKSLTNVSQHNLCSIHITYICLKAED